jgi:hypothetical protein
MENKFICFIDLLGTKEYAEENSEFYVEALSTFQTSLIEKSSLFEKDEAEIYFFSDCAYIQASDVQKLIKFLQAVRSNLSPLQYYFKGSITQGVLSPITGFEKNDAIAPNLRPSLTSLQQSYKKTKIKIHGTIFFGLKIGKAYLLQEKLKGIGIYIDKDIINNESLFNDIKDLIVKSIHLPNSSSTKDIESFYDIKYNEAELDDNNLELIFKNYGRTNRRYKSVSRYYITPLISCINSLNLSDNKIVVNKENNEFIESPFLVNKIRNFNRYYNDIYRTSSGFEYLFLILLNKIYLEKDNNLLGDNNDIIAQSFLESILKLSKVSKYIISNFDHLSTDIIAKNNKKLILDDFEALELKHEKKREKLKLKKNNRA